nr:hypothetical protein [Mycobacterium saskatchewanense]
MTDDAAAARDLAKDGGVLITRGGRVLDPDGGWRALFASAPPTDRPRRNRTLQSLQDATEARSDG